VFWKVCRKANIQKNVTGDNKHWATAIKTQDVIKQQAKNTHPALVVYALRIQLLAEHEATAQRACRA
jgi:hypothetical protein